MEKLKLLIRHNSAVEVVIFIQIATELGGYWCKLLLRIFAHHHEFTGRTGFKLLLYKQGLTSFLWYYIGVVIEKL